MELHETKPEYHFLGECYIMAVNQIGERVRVDKKSGGFILGRRGSVFKLHALLDTENASLDDFRDTSSVKVILETEGRLLVWNPLNGKASSVEMPQDVIPNDAKLLYVKRKFDGSSASISVIAAPHLWLRHSNSRLVFHEKGTGAQFNQDASFILTPIIAESKEAYKSTVENQNEASAVSEGKYKNTNDSVLKQSSMSPESSVMESLDKRIGNAMKRAKISNELLASRLSDLGRDLSI